MTHNAPKYEKQFKQARYLLDQAGIQVERGKMGDVYLLQQRTAETDALFVTLGNMIICGDEEGYIDRRNKLINFNYASHAIHTIETIVGSCLEGGTDYKQELQEVITALCRFSGRPTALLFSKERYQDIQAFHARVNGMSVPKGMEKI